MIACCWAINMKGETRGELLSKFHHMGVMVKNMDKAVEYFQALGIGPFEPSNLVHIDRQMYGKPVAADVKNIVKATTMGPIGIELIQPASGKSVHGEWVESHGEGINHIAFIVDDIEEATSIMVEVNPMATLKKPRVPTYL